MDPGEVMYYNWNRASMISRTKENWMSDAEFKMRLNFQNMFASAKTEEARMLTVAMTKGTLNPEIIKAVDKYMRGSNSID